MKNKQMAKTIECFDTDGNSRAAIKASLRNSFISFRITEGEWPHLTLDQAMRLLMWLHDAIDEGHERERRKRYV